MRSPGTPDILEDLAAALLRRAAADLSQARDRRPCRACRSAPHEVADSVGRDVTDGGDRLPVVGDKNGLTRLHAPQQVGAVLPHFTVGGNLHGAKRSVLFLLDPRAMLRKWVTMERVDPLVGGDVIHGVGSRTGEIPGGHAALKC